MYSLSAPLLNPEAGLWDPAPRLQLPRFMQVGKPPTSKTSDILGKRPLLKFGFFLYDLKQSLEISTHLEFICFCFS